ncbi:hypothetical protein [Thiomonas delicata]|uniref:Transposase IS200-like domain-containing protein n=1 Tax=Thiomonas delicata TaxID=364030 RepID=A0A238D5H3_THIDL|nr:MULTISPECIES: hypothetical protein [Thiomonas]SBP88481.1 conserved exported hypothetical protein [Thiomonas delicata]
MARQPRLCVPGLPHLVLLSAAAASQPLALEAQRWRFLAWLVEGLGSFPVQLHAYCVLPEAVWLLLTPERPAALSGLMQMLARRTSRALGGPVKPRGDAAKQAGVPEAQQQGSPARPAVWAGRFRSAVLQPQAWLLPAMVWVDAAAQREGLADADQPWSWSSHAAHCGLGGALGSAPALHGPQPYWMLGNTPFEREAAYSRLLQAGVDADRAGALQRALRSGTGLGDAAFLAELELRSGRSVRPARRGRPRKG